MKKSSTIVLSLLMALTMIFGLTGCGEEESSSSGKNESSLSGEEKVKLSTKTVNGLSFDVPDDFGDFAETQGVMLSTNEESTASIVVSGELDMMGRRPEDISKEYYTQTVIPNYTDVNFLEFKTDVTISYSTAVHTHFTAKSASGLEVESYTYLIYLPVDDGDGTMQSVMFSFTKDAENSLKANIDAVKSSLKFE
jgi:hypothetical protein